MPKPVFHVDFVALAALLLVVGLGACNALGPVPIPIVEGEGDALASLFPNGSTECELCLRAGCGTELESCASDDECRAIAECRVGDGTPAAQPRCAFLHPAAEPQHSYEQLSQCWLRGCIDECGLGSAWDCVDGYAWPNPQGDLVRITHGFTGLVSLESVVGAEVAVCTLDEASCGTGLEPDMLARTTTDHTGAYSVEVPVGRHGFRGIERIWSNEYPPHVIQLNIGLYADWERSTTLISRDLDALLRANQSARADRGQVLFQAFDCTGAGAEGVTVRLVESVPGARVIYTEELRTAATTTARGEGAGAILDLEPDTWISVEGTVATTGRVVFVSEIYVPRSGELALASLYPR